MRSKSRHILVTGAAHRVGRTIAETFLDRGDRVSAHYRNSLSEMRDFEAQAVRNGKQFASFQADLSHPAEATGLIEAVTQRQGPIDVLVHSAAVFLRVPTTTMKPAEWDQVFSVNLRGVFFLAQSWKQHLGSHPGVMVAIGDAFSKRGMPHYLAYATAKGALVEMCRHLAQEWAPQIRVCTVSPGPVLADPSQTAESRTRLADRTLLKRWGSAQDIAAAVGFVVDNGYLTGIDLAVDGGLTARTF